MGTNIALQYGWNGAGVGVAVIDSGIERDHPDLKPRVAIPRLRARRSAVDDMFGHGTHVAGIVARRDRLQGITMFVTSAGLRPRRT